MRSEVQKLEEQVDWLRARGDLRVLLGRVGRSALRALPLIVAGLLALALLEGWFGVGRLIWR